jgi:hypothetical protein
VRGPFRLTVRRFADGITGTAAGWRKAEKNLRQELLYRQQRPFGLKRSLPRRQKGRFVGA